MANEEKFGLFDQQFKRIEGETVNGEPAFAAAVFLADVSGNSDSSSFCLVASGSRNYAVSTAMQTKPASYKGAYLILDIYALPASGSISVFMDIRNPCDGEYSAIVQGATIQATGSVVGVRKYLVYPGAVDTDALLTKITQLPVPKQWRSRVLTGGGSGTWSYSLGVQYVE